MKPSLSIGIEEEYQTIDPVSFDLRSHIAAEIIAKGKRQLDEQVKAEMHQSVVEVGTGVCRNIKEARADACVQCGECEPKCTQHLKIMEEMRFATEAFKKG